MLEIGAGTGWQARELERHGFEVRAVDLEDSSYREERVHAIDVYDGHHLPFEDASFDVVFSSNVLEHIPHVEAFQDEVHRVLTRDGLAVHVLPTSAWRFWTTVVHPFQVGRLALRKLLGKKPRPSDSAPARTPSASPTRHTPASILRAFVPPRHGEAGNVLTELYYFHRTRWVGLFRRTGWHVSATPSIGTFYTGCALLGPSLSPTARRHLARFLGSACRIYLLRKATPQRTPAAKSAAASA